MPKTIPQILDLDSSSTSLNSVESTEGSSRMASTSSLSFAGEPQLSRIRTSHLIQNRPRKRKRTPIIQDEERDTASVPESTQRQLDASKQILYNVIDRIIAGQTMGHSVPFLYSRVEAICRYKHNEQKGLADYLLDKLDGFFKEKIENAIADVEDAGITESEGGQLFHSLEVCEHVLKGWKTWNTAIVKLSQVFSYLERNYLRSRKSSIVEYGKSKFTKTYFTDLLPPGTEKNTSYGDSLLKSYASITFVFYEAKYWKTF
ncbi:hypothetical protein CANMA_001428, partial [Candida margitis]|uniref:uncharacterized protein n=1 Tax=Candida margitis TaxID=1775924 RepID=UPI0022273DB4